MTMMFKVYLILPESCALFTLDVLDDAELYDVKVKFGRYFIHFHEITRYVEEEVEAHG
jgi:hypothetical protein